MPFQNDYNEHFDHMMRWNAGYGIAHLVVTTLIALVVIAVAVRLLTHRGYLGRHHDAHAGRCTHCARYGSGPEYTLADRLAKGEITPEDYEARLNALRGTKDA